MFILAYSYMLSINYLDTNYFNHKYINIQNSMNLPKWLGGKGIEQRHSNPNHNSEIINDTIAQALSFGFLPLNNTSRNLGVVYRATEIISDAVAMLPIKVRKVAAKHSEDITGHPLHFCFKNMIMTKYIFMKKLIEDVIINGNGYAYIQRGSDGTPISLRYLSKGEVTVNYNKSTQTLTYTISNVKGISTVKHTDMIHLIKNTTDGVNGISVLSYANRSIKLANSTENSAVNFFQSGCNLSGLLKVNGTLSQKQRSDILSSWNQGYSNGGNGLVVIPGNMEYEQLSQNASDSQLLETREYNTIDVARFFGINPVLLGDLSKTSYSSLELIQQDFILHTLNHYILMVEEEFTRKLLNNTDLVVNLDENYLLKIDKSTQASYYSTMLKSGVLCINEVREDMGLTPIDGGDDHVIPYTNLEQNTIGGTSNKEDTEK